MYLYFLRIYIYTYINIHIHLLYIYRPDYIYTHVYITTISKESDLIPVPAYPRKDTRQLAGDIILLVVDPMMFPCSHEMVVLQKNVYPNIILPVAYHKIVPLNVKR